MVAGYEEVACGGDVHACFVRERVGGVGEDTFESWVGAEEREEGGGVDYETAVLKGWVGRVEEGGNAGCKRFEIMSLLRGSVVNCKGTRLIGLADLEVLSKDW